MGWLRVFAAKWRRLRLKWHNRFVMRVWARGVADQFAEHDIHVKDVNDIEECFDTLEMRLLTIQQAKVMGDLFAEPPVGPFQRRLEDVAQG